MINLVYLKALKTSNLLHIYFLLPQVFSTRFCYRFTRVKHCGPFLQARPLFSGILQKAFMSPVPLYSFFPQLTLISRCSSLLGKVRLKRLSLLRAATRVSSMSRSVIIIRSKRTERGRRWADRKLPGRRRDSSWAPHDGLKKPAGRRRLGKNTPI